MIKFGESHSTSELLCVIMMMMVVVALIIVLILPLVLLVILRYRLPATTSSLEASNSLNGATPVSAKTTSTTTTSPLVNSNPTSESFAKIKSRGEISTINSDSNSDKNNWRCACQDGFLPPGLLKSFGGAEAMMRLGMGQCYHKQS